MADWNHDWKPGKYPRTEEERVKAAAKYGMLPEDYKPLPDDGSGHGDYPDLPWVGECQKDPYYDWDDHGRKRNYMDPVSIPYKVLCSVLS